MKVERDQLIRIALALFVTVASCIVIYTHFRVGGSVGNEPSFAFRREHNPPTQLSLPPLPQATSAIDSSEMEESESTKPHKLGGFLKSYSEIWQKPIVEAPEEPIAGERIDHVVQKRTPVISQAGHNESLSVEVTKQPVENTTIGLVETTAANKPQPSKSDTIEFLHVERKAASVPSKPAVKSNAPSMLSQALHFLDPVLHAAHKSSLAKPAATDASSKSPVKVTDNSGHITFLDTDTVNQHKASSTATKKKLPVLSNQIQILETHVISPNQTASKHSPQSRGVDGHPYISPRKGTNIDADNQMSVLLCPNQSKCIIPELQLQEKLKIYFCKHPVRYGVRFYFLAREGFLLHPNVELVSEPMIDTADFIVYLPGSAPWHKTECNRTSFAKKLIVLDEFDFHNIYSPASTKEDYTAMYGGPNVPWYYMYFKRSFVRRHDGKFLGYPHLLQREVYPLTYSIAEAYVPHHFNTKREIEVMCSLRGNKQMTTRLRVQEWVAEYGKVREIKNIITGELNHDQRTVISKQYFERMFNAQIIVTVNPANWEGDFRLWEALGTGALIFVDPVFVPHPYPLQDKVHVVYFSNNDKEDLWRKLDYYRAHPVEARKIAIQGYLHAMKYHRTVNMIDYILRTAHIKQATLVEHQANWPKYTYTGQYFNFEAKLQEHMIKSCHTPGIFEPATELNAEPKRLTTCPDRANFQLSAR